MRRQTIVILILSAILFVVALYKPQREGFQTADTIFTCTTFLDFKTGDRWDRFCHAIDSIRSKSAEPSLARIQEWLVVNEYAETPREDWTAKVKERYPFITFLQKGAHQKGQAASMNMILERITGFTYWIHWEEAWEVRAPFLEDAFKAMDSTDLTQIQLTGEKGKVDWMDMPDSNKSCKGRICEITAMHGIDKVLEYDAKSDKIFEALSRWPLYSLRPSINRVKPHLTLGRFNEDSALWPIKFEWDYARRWYRAGCKKGVFHDGPVWRPDTHKSTYA